MARAFAMGDLHHGGKRTQAYCLVTMRMVMARQTDASLELIMSKPATDDQSKPVELSDKELDGVTGGDMHFTKTVDQSSPNLFTACCTGKYVAS